MAKVDSITPEILRELIDYRPVTGKFYWRERGLEFFKDERSKKIWNTKYSGKETFTTDDSDGYKMSSVLGIKVKAHRVAWAIYYGEWPGNFIDHINLLPGDNRISNLRLATNSQNMMNGSLRSDNKSGYKGVYWCKEKGKWAAEGKIDGRKKFLGRFDCPKAAYLAYCAHAEEHYKAFARI